MNSHCLRQMPSSSLYEFRGEADGWSISLVLDSSAGAQANITRKRRTSMLPPLATLDVSTPRPELGSDIPSER
jgi:hypothetical protein